MIPLGQLLQAGSVNPSPEEQKRMEELAAIRAMLEQARSPQAAAQKRMDASDARNQAMRAGRAAIMAKYGQPIDIPALQARERSSQYTMLHDPGITRGLPARITNPVEDAPIQKTDKQLELEAAMNARSASIGRGEMPNRRRVGDAQYNKDRILQRINSAVRASGGSPEAMAALRQRLMASGSAQDVMDQEQFNRKSTNARVALAHGRLNPGMQEVLAGQGLIPNLPDLMAKRAAMVASAANGRSADPQKEAMSLLLLERLKEMRGNGQPADQKPVGPRVDMVPSGGTVTVTPPPPTPEGQPPEPPPPQLPVGLIKIDRDGTKTYRDENGRVTVVRPNNRQTFPDMSNSVGIGY